MIPVLDELFSMFGTPLVYKTDNGSPFQSHAFAGFAKRLGFRHRRITPRWPRANAETESFMKKLGKVLRTAVIEGVDKNVALRQFLRAYRETPHTTTKVAPAQLMMGYSRTSGIPQLSAPAYDQSGNQAAHRFAQENDRKAKEAMTREYNARMRVQQSELKVGDLVLLKLQRVCKTTPE